jgi:hypothetical protein
MMAALITPGQSSRVSRQKLATSKASIYGAILVNTTPRFAAFKRLNMTSLSPSTTTCNIPQPRSNALLTELDKGYDIVYGVTKEVSHGVFRAFAAWTIRKVLALSGNADYARVTSFRAFRAGLKRGLSVANGRSICLDTLLCWTGSKIGWVQIKRIDRPVGQSSYSFIKLVHVTLDLFLTDGSLSIKLLTVLGTLSLMLSSLSLILALLLVSFQIPLILVFIVLFLGGSQMLALALILEYQLRLSNSINCRLLFADREIVESNSFPMLLK